MFYVILEKGYYEKYRDIDNRSYIPKANAWGVKDLQPKQKEFRIIGTKDEELIINASSREEAEEIARRLYGVFVKE